MQKLLPKWSLRFWRYEEIIMLTRYKTADIWNVITVVLTGYKMVVITWLSELALDKSRIHDQDLYLICKMNIFYDSIFILRGVLRYYIRKLRYYLIRWLKFFIFSWLDLDFTIILCDYLFPNLIVVVSLLIGASLCNSMSHLLINLCYLVLANGRLHLYLDISFFSFIGLHRTASPSQPKRSSRLVCDRAGIPR